MQKKADSNGFGNTPGSCPQEMFSSGAFSYTSPPERVLLSDTTNQQDCSPFSTKFTVLKFNSANKSAGTNKSKSSHKSGCSGMKPKKLLDLQVDGQILGKGIFSQSSMGQPDGII